MRMPRNAQRVVVISAASARWAIASGQFKVDHFRQSRREEVLLDARGQRQLLLDLLSLDGFAEIPGVFKRDGGLRDQPHYEFQSGWGEGEMARARSKTVYAAGSFVARLYREDDQGLRFTQLSFEIAFGHVGDSDRFGHT